MHHRGREGKHIGYVITLCLSVRTLRVPCGENPYGVVVVR